ncbi:hypothetical protein BH10PLA2_BH10PLA2_11300 [soil metagenome]
MRRQRQNRLCLEIETLEDRFTPAIGFQGGAVVAHAQVVAVYAGDYWATTAGTQAAAQINTFLSYIVNSSYMDTMVQYGVGRGTTLGVGIIDSQYTGTGTVTDETIQSVLSTDLASGRLPKASINTLYLVFTAPNVTPTSSTGSDSFSDYGYHNVFVYNSTDIVNYAVIANPIGNSTAGSLTNFQTTTLAITQQLANALTDPLSNGWIDTSTGEEIASKVDGPGNYAYFNNYVVAGLWSVLQQSAAYPAGSTPPDFNPPADQIITSNVMTPVANYFTHTLEYFNGVVERYYENFLRRHAGQDELNYWAVNLSAGTRAEQVLSQIASSDEYFQKAGSSNAQWLETLYRDMFQREIDSSGESSWLQALNSGATRQQVALFIGTSTEREAIVVGTYYQAYLGRTGSTSEIAYWVGAIQSGATQQQVVTITLSSGEYLSRTGGSLQGWLTGVYQAALKRSPDAAGYDAWIRVLNGPFAS